MKDRRMPILAKQTGGGDFQIAPEGQFAAACQKVIDCGTQKIDGDYGTKNVHQVIIGFEIHGENQVGDGDGYMNGDPTKPFTIQQRFTLSLSDKSKLKPFLQSWRGKPFTPEELDGFNIANLIGAPCMLTIQHTKSKDGQKTYANITTITPILKALAKPKLANAPLLFEIDPWSDDAFGQLSDGMREIVRKSAEYKELFGGATEAQKPENEDQRTPVDANAPFDNMDPPFGAEAA